MKRKLPGPNLFDGSTEDSGPSAAQPRQSKVNQILAKYKRNKPIQAQTVLPSKEQASKAEVKIQPQEQSQPVVIEQPRQPTKPSRRKVFSLDGPQPTKQDQGQVQFPGMPQPCLDFGKQGASKGQAKSQVPYSFGQPQQVAPSTLQPAETSICIQKTKIQDAYQYQTTGQAQLKKEVQKAQLVDYRLLSFKDKGMRFLASLAQLESEPSYQVVKQSITGQSRRYEAPSLPDQSYQTQFYWHIVRQALVGAEIQPLLYQFICEKIPVHGYHEILVLGLLKLSPEFSQFMLGDIGAYLPCLMEVVARHRAVIPAAQLQAFAGRAAEALLLLQGNHLPLLAFYSLGHKAINTQLVERVLRKLSSVPLTCVLTALVRNSWKAPGQGCIELKTSAILNDAGNYEQALQLLSAIKERQWKAKDLKQISLEGIKCPEPQSQSKAGLLSFIGSAFGSKKVEKPAQIWEQKSDMRYDATLGRWLINGEVPSDGQEKEETKQEVPVPPPPLLPPPPSGGQGEGRRNRRGAGNRYTSH